MHWLYQRCILEGGWGGTKNEEKKGRKRKGKERKKGTKKEKDRKVNQHDERGAI